MEPALGLWMEPVLLLLHTGLSHQPLAPLGATFLALSTHLPNYTFISVPLKSLYCLFTPVLPTAWHKIDVQKYLWTDILIAFVSVVTPDITSWCRKLGNTFSDIYPSMSAQCAWWHQKVPSFRRGKRVRKPKGQPCSATNKLCNMWQVSFPLSILIKCGLESAGLEDLSVSSSSNTVRS